MPRFQGIPVQQQSAGPRFKGGVPVSAQPTEFQPNLTGVPVVGGLLGAIGFNGAPVDPNYQPSMVPFLDPVNAAASKFVSDIPVVGPALDKFGNQVDAGINNLLTGQNQTPEDRAAINAADQQRYPVAATAGGVAGTVAPLAVAGSIPLGGKLLGFTGPLAQRVLFGAGTGALLSGADSLARGDSPQEAGVKAGVGGALGSTFPVVEKGVGAVVSALLGRRPPAAAQIVAKGLDRDGIDPATIPQQLQNLGQDAVIADLGTNLRRQAAAVASLPGKGQTLIVDAIKARNLGRNGRIQGDVNDILGPAPIPSRVAATIKENQGALSPAYEAVFANASAVDTSDLAAALDSLVVNERGAGQKAAQKVRSMLDIYGAPGNLDPNPETLFRTRNEIDGMIAAETNTNALRILGDVRKQVDDVLAQSVPYLKQVDAKYEQLAEQKDAFGMGQQTLASGKEAPRPADVQQMMTEGAIPSSPVIPGPSGVPFQLSQGARAEIDRIIGTTANNLTALKSALKGDGSWNRDRLVSLFGKEKADKLLDVLDREVAYDETGNVVTRNSETAARLAGQKDVAPMEVNAPPSLTGLVLAIPQKVANVAAKARSEQVNQQIAQALMSRGNPAFIDQIIAAQAMGRRPALMAPAALPLLTNRAF